MVIIKKESAGTVGIDPADRTTEEIIQYGIVNIDKPKGPTSHQVSDYVQKILGISKAGHSGTLDPHVTGVLVVALGKATRIVQTLLPAGKEYVCLMHVHKEVGEKRLRSVLAEFIGKIRQKPPVKSSVKRVERTRNVYYMDVLEIDGQDVLFRVGCQAGTYIRKLCHDIGRKLECGAHMQQLRRTKAGPFDETTCYTLQDLADAYFYHKSGNDSFLRKMIMPVESALTQIKKIWVLDNTLGSLSHGIDLKVPGISKLDEGICIDEPVAVMSLKDELISLGTAKLSSEDMQKADKGIAVDVHKVFRTL